MRFEESEARAMGRSAAGVIGVKLRGDDVVEACVPVRDDEMLLLVTDGGYGKRTAFDEFSTKHRGGQGVTAIKLTGGKGFVVSARGIGPDDDVLMISTGGTLIRVAGSDISEQGPYATGVSLMRLAPDERVAAVATIDDDDHDDTGTASVTPGAGPDADVHGNDAGADGADVDEADRGGEADEGDRPD